MINFAKYSLLLYLLLKPFYLFGSGGLQIADGFLLIGFVLFFVASRLSSSGRQQMREVIHQHKFFILFVVCTFIVNGAYFAFYPELKFVLSSLYFTFNLLAIVVFTVFSKDTKFLSKVGSIFKFNLFLQLLLWLTHLGRFYTPDRYMGSFNDPNQFGYYVLLSFLFIYFIDMLLKTKHTYIYYILALLLILQSGSTGMLFGIGIFSIFVAVYLIRKELRSPYRLIQRVMYSLVIVAMLAIPLSVIAAASYNDIKKSTSLLEGSSIFLRLDEKTEKATGGADISLIQDRNLDTISEYPHFIIYGSGEGAFERFQRATYPGSEIHSTFPAMLFYYGLIPFFMAVAWIARQLKGLKWDILVVYMTLLTVSFTLLNQRQALFWILLALGPIALSVRENQRTVDVKNNSKAEGGMS